MDAETRAKTPNEERNLCAFGTPVHVCLVKDKQKLSAVLFKPSLCFGEDGTFERAHQHVLEHRVVGDEHVWRVARAASCAVDHLLPGQQLAIAGSGMKPTLPIVVRVFLASALAALVRPAACFDCIVI